MATMKRKWLARMRYWRCACSFSQTHKNMLISAHPHKNTAALQHRNTHVCRLWTARRTNTHWATHSCRFIDPTELWGYWSLVNSTDRPNKNKSDCLVLFRNRIALLLFTVINLGKMHKEILALWSCLIHTAGSNWFLCSLARTANYGHKDNCGCEHRSSVHLMF